MNLTTNSTDEFIITFFENNIEWISELDVEGKWQIGATTENDCLRYSVADDKTPMGINSALHCIAINVEQCNHYGLTDNMKTAMLYHEIGHVIYPVVKSPDEDEQTYSLRKEMAADQLAIERGFGEALRNGLQHLVDSGDFENGDMISRIDRLR